MNRLKRSGAPCAGSKNARTPWPGALSCTFAAALAVNAPSALAQSAAVYLQPAPQFVATSKEVATEDAGKTIELTVWLMPRDRAAMNALAQELYDKSSPSYRHWLTHAHSNERFAPTDEAMKAVRDYLESSNLHVLRTEPNNYYVRVSGTVADVQRAFGTQLKDYQFAGSTIRANATSAVVKGSAASYILSISGLVDATAEHHLAAIVAGEALRGEALRNALAARQSQASKAAPAPQLPFNAACFPGAATFEATSNGGSYPKGAFAGNVYDSGPIACAYTPANVYKAYALSDLYARGLDGSGQTIVIIDWCGSPTILADANEFSKQFGLPALTSANFSVIQPTPSQCAASDPEINLDVEWAHAIAPGASIALVEPASASLQDVDEAWFYAVNYGLGNVISGSYGVPEFLLPSTELEKDNLIAELGAIAGIASNFSSGDGGSMCSAIGGGCSVQDPADLPYSTGVGGVSVALKADGSFAFQTGWETYYSFLEVSGAVQNPPFSPAELNFAGGSGGGASAHFAKPAFQSEVAGHHRGVPDVAWLADPLTAVAIFISEPGQYPEQVWLPVGGTSVACPTFSALWAIANQAAGEPLGQAAPYLYSMANGAIVDVLPLGSATNVTATIAVSSTVSAYYDPLEVFNLAPIFSEFYSAQWDSIPLTQGTVEAFTFGGDYFLKVEPGWDDVTGVGTPNPVPFVDGFAPKTE